MSDDPLSHLRQKMDMADLSKLIVREDKEPFRKRRNAVVRGLRRRCPIEILYAKSLAISRGAKCHRHENHFMVMVNDLELCPVSAMMYVASAKSYRWPDIKRAINRILSESASEN